MCIIFIIILEKKRVKGRREEKYFDFHSKFYTSSLSTNDSDLVEQVLEWNLNFEADERKRRGMKIEFEYSLSLFLSSPSFFLFPLRRHTHLEPFSVCVISSPFPIPFQIVNWMRTSSFSIELQGIFLHWTIERYFWTHKTKWKWHSQVFWSNCHSHVPVSMLIIFKLRLQKPEVLAQKAVLFIEIDTGKKKMRGKRGGMKWKESLQFSSWLDAC